MRPWPPPMLEQSCLVLQEKCAIFSCRRQVGEMEKVIEGKILSRVYGNGRGWAFSQADFADLGVRSTVDSALHRKEKEGLIRRVIRGIYDYPRHSELLQKTISPDIDQVAHALARKFAWRIQPRRSNGPESSRTFDHGFLRESFYLSDGPNRSYSVGKTALAFEHTALKEAGFRLRESRLVVQALKNLGEKRISAKVITHIRKQLPPALRRKILMDTKTATGWVYAAIQKIARESPRG